MDDYISREQAIAEIMGQPPDAHYPSWYAEQIKKLPAADVRPERYATWTLVDESEIVWECSNCGCMWSLNDGGTPHENDMNYCPECGALIVRLKEEENHDNQG